MLVPLPSACAVFALSSLALAQAPTWVDTFSSPGTSDAVYDTLVFDDGSGEALYAAGEFGSAGKAPAMGVARWDGSQWQALGGGIQLEGFFERVIALEAVDLGAGPQLLALGRFFEVEGQPAKGVALWDGSQWDALAGGPAIPGDDGSDELQLHCAVVHDLGGGPELYVGGTVENGWFADECFIARWDGASWSTDPNSPQVASLDCDPFLKSCTNGNITGLYSFDDGGGPALFAAGNFDVVGGQSGAVLARLDAGGWQPAPGTGPGGIEGAARLSIVDYPGGQPQLMLVGFFTNAPAAEALTYDASGFGALPDPPHYFNHLVHILAVTGYQRGVYGHSGGGGTSGNFQFSRWSGSQWETYSRPVGYPVDIFDMAAFDGGQGRQLVLAGEFVDITGPQAASNIARWNGTTFKGLHDGSANLGFRTQFGSDSWIEAAEVHDMGSGPKLYVGGRFTRSASTALGNFCSWNGSGWTHIPGLTLPYLTEINCLAGGDLGDGPRMWLGGDVKVGSQNPVALARWDGSSMTTLPLQEPALDVQLVELGGQEQLVYVRQSTVYGSLDGVTFDFSGSFNFGSMRAMTMFDAGEGERMFFAGSFTKRYDYDLEVYVDTQGLSSWDGSDGPSGWTDYTDTPSWQITSSGGIHCVLAWDDGSGTRLFAGGNFEDFDGLLAWDGSTWTEVGGGVQGLVTELVVFDDGTGGGPALYVSGDFDSVGGGVAARNLARWDGTSWQAAGLEVEGQGPSELVRVMEVLDLPDFGGRTLVLGGDFDSVGGVAATRLAMLPAADQTGIPYCYGDGSIGSCPCGNVGATGAGCANSTGLGGRITASGEPSLTSDSLTFHGSDMPDSPVLFYQGLVSHAPLLFGDGVRCAGGPVVRLKTKVNVGGASTYPEAGDESISERAGLVSTGTRYYSAWYRDGMAACGAGDFNFTNAVEVLWGP